MSAGEIRARIRVDDSGCWRWLGSVVPNGYARGWLDKRLQSAHRHSYEVFVGPIPEGLQIDHLCRVRDCVNPEHLEPVTPKVNNLRAPGSNGNKTHCPQGHPYDDENTYVAPRTGRRHCRTCKRRHKAEFNARRDARTAVPRTHNQNRRAA